jgi:two-component system, OmpR family, phosphate regulon sensor histidine kinase PhoR
MLTKTKIRLIITLMCVAVAGLLAFQWYWINNIFKLQNEQFGLKVTDALQEVVRKLEKQEILYLTRQRAETEQQKRRLAMLGKSQVASRKTPTNALSEQFASSQFHGYEPDFNDNDALTPRNRKASEQQQRLINEFLKNRADANPRLEKFLKEHAEQERAIDQWMADFAQTRNRFLKENFPDLPRFEWDSTKQDFVVVVGNIDEIKTNKNGLKQRLRARKKNQNNGMIQSQGDGRTDILRDVFKDLLFGGRPVEDRINGQALDSLLRKTLQERGIAIQYQFAVKNSLNQSPIFSTADFKTENGGINLFKATLFPNEINNVLSQLIIYFPDSQSFIINNLRFTLLVSGLLLVLMLGCFYAAISTIIKQKKVADIKNDFINNMTHEFKTPIATISLAVDMAREQTENTEPKKPLQRYLNIIRDENHRLGDHVEKVLQMALLERGQINLNYSNVNIHEIIERVLNNIGVQIEKKQGVVELEFEANNENVQADEMHLTNIIYNLVDNANKYSPQIPNIKVATRNDESGLFFSVSDTGLGINKEQLNRIFDQFYRVPTGNLHDVKGFGLGLSYVKKTVEAHGGTITVESQIGQGSTFEVFLPTYNVGEVSY